MTFQRDLAWQQLELANRASIAHHCARYALALNYSLLPEEVVHQAKRCLLDAMGCAIGASHAPGRTILEETVKEIGGPEEATVFCSGLRTSALNASLMNSFLIRFLDYNDLGGGGHNSDALGSIMAVAEREQATGPDLITSMVISCELGTRFREATTSSLEKKGWSSDIRAGLNQPPALGKLMGMTEEQIANAIGICMSHTLPPAILDSDTDEYVMAKNIRFGWAAHDAILACMLAKKGFTGPRRIMESEWGIRRVVAQGDMDFERLIDFSGWRMLKVRFKPLPCAGSSQGHLFATLSIVKEHDLRPEDIAAVHIKASAKESKHTTTLAKKYARNAESADHSLFFLNALAIKQRVIDDSSIIPENFTDPVILDLVEKITVECDPSLVNYQGESQIVTKDGRRFSKRVERPHGRGDDVMSDAELEEKFCGMAARHMHQNQYRKIIDACWNADKLKSVGELTELMVF